MRRLIEMLILAAAAGLAATPPSAVAASNAWTQVIPASVPDGGRPTVGGGRVSHLALGETAATASTATVQSRRLDGQDRRTVTLGIGALRPPAGTDEYGRPFTAFVVDKVRYAPGHVAAIGYWRGQTPFAEPGPGDTGGNSSPISTLAVFDDETGALSRQQDYDQAVGGALFLPGSPGILALTTPPDSVATGALEDPVAGSTLPLTYPKDQVTHGGALIVTYPDTPGSRWKKDKFGTLDGGYGVIRATRWRDGRRAWDVSTTSVARRALMPATTPGMQIGLTDDGLPVLAAGGPRRDVRIVTVNTQGTLKRLGRRLPGIGGFWSVTRSGRAIVAVFGSKKVGRRTKACGGVWLTDASGKRGRRLPRITERLGQPIGWDGDSAIWFYDSGDDDKLLVRAETNLTSRKLSASDLPRCR